MAGEASPSQAPTPPAGRRAARGPGFNREEVKQLLRLARALLPSSADDWEALARAYNAKVPLAPRTSESLRRKFLKMGRRDATSRARRIKEQIALHALARKQADAQAPEAAADEQQQQQLQDQAWSADSGNSSESDDSELGDLPAAPVQQAPAGPTAARPVNTRRVLDELAGDLGGRNAGSRDSELGELSAALMQQTPVASAAAARPASTRRALGDELAGTSAGTRNGGRRDTGAGDQHLAAGIASSATPVTASRSHPVFQTPPVGTTPPSISAYANPVAAEVYRASPYSQAGAESPGSVVSALSTPMVVNRWLALEERRALLEEQRMALEQRRIAVEERRLRLMEQKMDADTAERKQLLEMLKLTTASMQRRGRDAADL